MAGKPLRTVLAGCGKISRSWLGAGSGLPGLEIAGLVDLDPKAADEKKEAFGLADARTGGDLAAMLKAVQPDVVFDCTVPAAHKAVVTEALKHGCHVLGEKPLAENMADARRMVRAAQAAGKVYAVMQNRRFDPNIAAFRDLLHSGKMGALAELHADFYLAPRFGGFREQMRHVLLVDMAIHTFDAARFLMGRDAAAVYCADWNPEGSWFAHGASAVAVFEMEGGAVFTYRGSWCAQGLGTSWNSAWRAVGDRGSAAWDGAKSIRGEAPKDPASPKAGMKEIAPRRRAMKHVGHAGLIRDFVSCVRTGKTPQTVCTDNVKSLAMVVAAVKSAETRRRVKVG